MVESAKLFASIRDRTGLNRTRLNIAACWIETGRIGSHVQTASDYQIISSTNPGSTSANDGDSSKSKSNNSTGNAASESPKWALDIFGALHILHTILAESVEFRDYECIGLIQFNIGIYSFP